MDKSTVEITVVGSCNMDLITYAPRLPVSGETLHGHRYVTGFGGKGANQCVAAAKLGATTAMVAKVGTDNNGESFINNFKSLQINTDEVTQTNESSTGVAPITVGDDGSNSIVIVAGANLLLSSSDVDRAAHVLQHTKVLMCQLEIPSNTTLTALRVARSFHVLTIFNPAPAPTHDLDPEFYTLSDIMCPNETEAFVLTGINVVDVDSAKQAAIVLVNKGCNIGVVTLGDKGCVYVEKDSMKPKHIIPKQVTAIDTTGAGDAFAGSLGFFMVRFPHLSLHEKLSRACYVASVSVCHEGTQTSFPVAGDLSPDIFSAENIFD